MKVYKPIPYQAFQFSEDEMIDRIKMLHDYMKHRRTVRDFSTKDIPEQVLHLILSIANGAPSGANKQPWTFCIVRNPELKKKIRIAAEEEERENYNGRMSKAWIDDLAHLGTDWRKPFLEIAPVLIVVFRKSYDFEEGEKHKNYYVQESVGLACGFLLAAIHYAGLVSLTHTPSPMNFLQDILKRPENEKPFLLIPVGYPAEQVTVPEITKKEIKETAIFYL